jgi:hypothetical protein
MISSVAGRDVWRGTGSTASKAVVASSAASERSKNQSLVKWYAR